MAEKGEGFPHLEGPSGAWIRGERTQDFPCSRLGKSARLSGRVLRPQKPPLCHVGPGSVGGEQERPGVGGRRQAVRRAPPGPEEWERSGGRWPRPPKPGNPAGLPGRVPHPQWPPRGHVGPGGIGGRPGRSEVESTPGPLQFL